MCACRYLYALAGAHELLMFFFVALSAYGQIKVGRSWTLTFVPPCLVSSFSLHTKKDCNSGDSQEREYVIGWLKKYVSVSVKVF